jgi:putative transposase
MTALPQRQQLIADILEAQSTGARLALACAELGLSVRSFERWRQSGEIRPDGRPLATRPEPAHKLTPEERQRILETCHEPRFVDLPPAQIVPQLADEGTYLASESSFYRVLRQARQQHHRGRSRAPVKTEPARHIARGSNEIWSRDVTYLPSGVRGQFFYLYAVLDIFTQADRLGSA